MPGATVGILRHGVVTTAYYGVADVTTSEPVTPDTVFSVGSLTKSMVATVVARLADRGRLSLDDRVATHVPELRASGWAERASVRDLLANRPIEFPIDLEREAPMKLRLETFACRPGAASAQVSSSS